VASQIEINAAVEAYNRIWDAAKDVDAHTAPKIRREAMNAALDAADETRKIMAES
jgi:hypothetical protein